jgi:hypothetical protein
MQHDACVSMLDIVHIQVVLAMILPASSPSICTAANTAALTEFPVLIEPVAVVCAACESYTAATTAATV